MCCPGCCPIPNPNPCAQNPAPCKPTLYWVRGDAVIQLRVQTVFSWFYWDPGMRIQLSQQFGCLGSPQVFQALDNPKIFQIPTNEVQGLKHLWVHQAWLSTEMYHHSGPSTQCCSHAGDLNFTPKHGAHLLNLPNTLKPPNHRPRLCGECSSTAWPPDLSLQRKSPRTLGIQMHHSAQSSAMGPSDCCCPCLWTTTDG